MSRWVIEGVREDGRRFRPSDWVERLAAVAGGFGPDHRLRYAPWARPRFVNGEKCLEVDERLEAENPAAYKLVFEFAASNGLRVTRL